MKQDNKILKLVYTFFLGIIIALFIGFGINTFYPSPAEPQIPERLNTLNNTMSKTPTDEQITLQNQYDKTRSDFEKNKMNPYNRNVSIISLSAAVILLALSLFLEKRNIKVISDGIMMGGLFMLIYSIGRGVASKDNKYMFMAVSVGLITVVYLGYHRFVDNNTSKKKSKK